MHIYKARVSQYYDGLGSVKIMDLIVQKYGGTSVGSPDRIKHVAKRVVESRKYHSKVVVVVSAMGDTTDHLVGLAKEMSANPHPREYDQLVSTGENISAALLAMAVQDLGLDAISLTGAQAGIKTEMGYSRAKIQHVKPTRIHSELEAGKVVIVTGFQGINDVDDVTTIGRGGSDTSAVVLAAALQSPVCEIYTDVDGVYTTDPRRVPEARKLPVISYDEMLELASLGAKVLHPRAVECAKEHGIELHVRSSFDSSDGTFVKEVMMENAQAVTGATLSEQEARVSLLQVSDEPGVAGSVFTRLSDVNINVDMIIQSVEENRINNITFTVNEDDLSQTESIAQEIAKDVGAKGVKVDSNIAKLSIVGVGMISKSGVAATMFKTLGDHGINIQLIATSEIKISCIIDRAQAREALRLIHEAFELDKGVA